MSNIDIKCSLKTKTSYIEKQILQKLKPQVDDYLHSVFLEIQPKLVDLLQNSIKNSPEYMSLQNGKLRAEFGLKDSETALDTILGFWSNVTAKYKPVAVKSNKLVGGFTIEAIKSDYSDVLSLSVASITTEKQQELNWLEWLLLFGNKTIIKDYVVEMGSNPRSRTGIAIMRGQVSGKWSVPSEYSGTQNNNWITRVIDSIDENIHSLIIKSMKE